jgi:hypothetical protein
VRPKNAQLAGSGDHNAAAVCAKIVTRNSCSPFRPRVGLLAFLRLLSFSSLLLLLPCLKSTLQTFPYRPSNLLTSQRMLPLLWQLDDLAFCIQLAALDTLSYAVTLLLWSWCSVRSSLTGAGGGGVAFHEVGRNSVCKAVCMAAEADLVNSHKRGRRQIYL